MGYVEWCRRFHGIRKRFLRHHQRWCIRALELHCAVSNEVRQSKYRRGLLRKREAFCCLRWNIIVERSILRSRLHFWNHALTGRPSFKNFATITLLPWLFRSWASGYLPLARLLRTWDTILAVALLKYGFCLWRNGVGWKRETIIQKGLSILGRSLESITRPSILMKR